jgi:hypothetical protein
VVGVVFAGRGVDYHLGGPALHLNLQTFCGMNT